MYITGSSEAGETTFYLTTISDTLNQMTPHYADEVFSKKDPSDSFRNNDRELFIEYFTKKYDRYVESSNKELFSLSGSYQYIEEATYLKNGDILVVIENRMANAEDKTLILINNDKKAKIIYENSNGFELISYKEDKIVLAVLNNSGKYEFVNIEN
ncbi:MAG: hypothetical protein ACOCUD_04895 [Bacillota bacterium]